MRLNPAPGISGAGFSTFVAQRAGDRASFGCGQVRGEALADRLAEAFAELAELVGLPEIVVTDTGHAAGKRMRRALLLLLLTIPVVIWWS